jgi:3-oxoadipate enol-lactonase
MKIALAYELAGPGDAPPLVLGGSLGSTYAMWDPQWQALAGDFRLVRFDHRGHGASPVPPGPYSIDELGADALALLDRLELARVSYCGLSLGGMVGMWLAINAPERIERLVLICTSAHIDGAAYAERAVQVRDAGTVAAVSEAVLGRWFTPPFTAEHPAVIDAFRTMLNASAPEGYAGCAEAIAAMDLRDGLGSIAAPTLVIAGADDPALPPEHGEAIATAIPGARFVVLEPAAHLANVEQADAVTRLIHEHAGEEAR